MPLKLAYTTGEAARICRLSQTLIIRLFDAGTLRGYYVPDSRVRRIPREELERFLIDHALPNPFARMADADVPSQRTKPSSRTANCRASHRIP